MRMPTPQPRPHEQRSLMSALFLMFTLMICGGTAHAEQLLVADPGIPDTLRIDSVVVEVQQGNAQIPVRFYNDEDLGGIELSFFASSSVNVTLDSFSFAGGRVVSIPNKGVERNGDTLTIYCIPFTGVISPGNGLFGTIFASFPNDMKSEIVAYDSLTFTLNSSQHSTTFSTADAQLFKPKFKRGYLDAQNNCCVGIRGNINGDPDNRINVIDALYLAYYLYLDGDKPPCVYAADVNGDNQNEPDIQDLVYLVNYMFSAGPVPSACP